MQDTQSRYFNGNEDLFVIWTEQQIPNKIKNKLRTVSER